MSERVSHVCMPTRLSDDGVGFEKNGERMKLRT
jgi:hypothetical protein